MEFSKYEAAGNDFIVVNAIEKEDGVERSTAVAMCDRRRGVGADGLIQLLPSEVADVGMRIINADGSDAEMCGNGIRALHLFALDQRIASGHTLDVETAAGVRRVEMLEATEGTNLFTVRMGGPVMKRGDIPMSGNPAEEAIGVLLPLDDVRSVRVTCLSMGNPHCVIFVDDPREVDVEEIGPIVENHEVFPGRTNVEFASMRDGQTILARVWERGVGETPACGTGACACLVAARLNGIAGERARVVLPGGELTVEWADNDVHLTGEARRVFSGRWQG
jgi:diaminopimelate epimerase